MQKPPFLTVWVSLNVQLKSYQSGRPGLEPGTVEPESTVLPIKLSPKIRASE